MTKDDEIRQQRQQQKALPKLSRGEIENNRKVLNDIIYGNKRRRDEGLKKEEEKTELLAKESLNRFNVITAMHAEHAEKKVQEVLDYYGN